MAGAAGDIAVLFVGEERPVHERDGQSLRDQRGIDAVETVTTGSECLERFDDRSYDCIVSEADVSDMTGIELFNAVRARWPDAAVVLLADEGSDAVVSQAIEAGITDYFQRCEGSVQFARLATRIRHAVSRQQSTSVFEDIFEKATAGILIQEPETGEILDANQRFCEMNELARDTVVGMDVADFSIDEPPYTDEKARRRIRNAAAGDPQVFEWVNETRSGERLPVEVHLKRTTIGGNERVLAIVHDRSERKQRERELHELKERLDLAVEAADLGVWDWNVQTGEVTYNEQWATMLGHSLSEIDSHVDAWKRRVHPDDRPAVMEALDAHLAGETEYYETEHRVQTAESEWKWIRDVGTVTEWSDDGEPLRAVGIHQDIDDRKKRERALAESESRYRSLFESNPAVVWEEDFSDVVSYIDSIRKEAGNVSAYLDENPAEVRTLLEKVEIIDVSERAVERYGADSKADLMENLDAIFTEAAFEVNKEIWHRLAAGETHFRVPTVAETFDGDRLEEIMEVRVPDAYEDDLSRVYLTVIDVTDRKRREQKLTALHDVATDLETGGSIEYICERTIEASEAILEFDLSVIDLEADGVLSAAAISEEMSERITERMSIEEGFAGKTYRTGESQLIADMSAHDEATPAGPFQSGISIPIGEHGVFQAVAKPPDAFDTTDLELAELLVSHTESALDSLDHERQLRRQNERLEAFANIVSHDLRNPLNVASGHLELLGDSGTSDHVDAIERAHGRMDELIDDLLTLTMEGHDAMTMESVDLASAVDHCWQTVETTEATLDVETDQTIRADPGHLRRLLENLVRNAVEHGIQNGEQSSRETGAQTDDVAITITVGSLPDRDGFYVADDGQGITDEEYDAVFDSGYTTSPAGTGYGLMIVEHVADTHGWVVDVAESEAGGARFEIADVTVIEESQ